MRIKVYCCQNVTCNTWGNVILDFYKTHIGMFFQQQLLLQHKLK